MKIVHVSGRRKRSIARATIREGKGQIRINSQLLEDYKPLLAKNKILEPLTIAGNIIKNLSLIILK